MSDQGSQTIYSKYELSAKVETMILKNDVSTMQLQGPKIVSTLSYENIVQDIALVKHFTGLKPSQFEVFHDFRDDVCRLETMNYWKSKDCPATENARTGPKADSVLLSRLLQLFLVPQTGKLTCTILERFLRHIFS